MSSCIYTVYSNVYKCILINISVYIIIYVMYFVSMCPHVYISNDPLQLVNNLNNVSCNY